MHNGTRNDGANGDGDPSHEHCLNLTRVMGGPSQVPELGCGGVIVLAVASAHELEDVVSSEWDGHELY